MEFAFLGRIAENENWRNTHEWKHRYEEVKCEDPPTLQPRHDTNDDTVDLVTYWYTITSPKLYLPIFFSLRATLLAALPLMILSDRFKTLFPGSALLGLWGMVCCKNTIGEGFMMAIISIQTAVWGMIWGTLTFYWGALNHTSGWWCAVIFMAFFVSLLGDLKSKRLLVMMGILMMEMGRLNIIHDPTLFAQVGSDLLLSTAFGLFQTFCPPFQITTEADKSMRKAWKDVGNIVKCTATACWSRDPVEVLMSLSRVSTEPLHRDFTLIGGQLFFVMYEPWESTLRLELRKERMNVLRHIIPHLHAMAAAARSLHTHQSVKEVQRNSLKLSTSSTTIDGRDTPTEFFPLPPTLTIVKDYLHAPLQTYLEALDATFDALGKYLNPRETAENVPFGHLHKATSELQSAIDRLHFDTAVKIKAEIDSVEYMNIVFAHLMMVLLGEEILKYGELMQNFDRKRYKSGWRRFVEFFFLDYWNSFWSELPNRLTLATPRDVRLFKDAIKISLAYGVGCMFTIYIDPAHVDYFGMAILVVVGLPTAGESLMSGVQRVAGVAFAAAISFVSRAHSNTDVQKYAIALCGVFISCYARGFTAYFHAATYAMLMTMSFEHLWDNPMHVLTRVVSNSFTVMTYYAIVVFLFPIDTIKVLHNMEVMVVKSVSDNFFELISLVIKPVDLDDEALRKRLGEMQGRFVGLWASVQKVVLWIPLVAAEPTIRGMPYPAAAQTEYMPVLRRLASSLDILRIGLLGIHRKRIDGLDKDLQETLTSVGKLLRTIETYSCYIMQDFVDALQRPLKWKFEDAARHFSILTRLNMDLKDAFAMAMHSSGVATRREFELLVFRRSFLDFNNSREPFTPSVKDCESNIEELSTIEVCTASPESNVDKDTSEKIRMIEEKEREELTAPRRASFLLRPQEFTIHHDVNMSIAVLVGIDMFCHELDKTLWVMSEVNRFERSRRK